MNLISLHSNLAAAACGLAQQCTGPRAAAQRTLLHLCGYSTRLLNAAQPAAA